MYKRVLVIPDIHIPYHDKKAMSLVSKRIVSFKPDEIIQLGDLLDFPTLHVKSKDDIKQATAAVISEDYKIAQMMLNNWQQRAPEAHITLLEGNHEDRVNRLLKRQPDLVGSLEVPVRLDLKARGITWLPSWSKSTIYSIGKANFCHGFTAAIGHTAIMAKMGCNIFYGHTHDFESRSFRRLGKKDTYVTQSCGYLADPKPIADMWQMGRPQNWQQGWLEFYISSRGHFQYFIVRIIKGQAICPDGSVLK